VTDANTSNPVAAAVFINDYFPTYSDPTAGDYHKYVLPGTYSMTIVANGYETQTIDNVTVTANSSTVTNFQLQPQEEQYIYKICSSQIPDNNTADEGNTPAIIGDPDNINYSIGKNGWVVVDMQYPIVDGPDEDIRVIEGDASPEGYTCYAGETMDGPWVSLGTGTGTTEFDLATGGFIEAQFIKILDDGDGSANVADAGFDLDAMQSLEPVSGIYLALYNYYIDDSNGNGNGIIDPGETVDIIVTIRNNGDITAENVIGIIDASSTYITIVNSTANFGNIQQGETADGTYTITADASTPCGQNVMIDLDVSSNNGTYTNHFEMNFVVGQIPVIIVDLDPNTSSGPDMETVIQNLGVSIEYTTSFPTDPDLYSTIFVCLGIYSSNHVLSSSQGQALAGFLNNGGSLYMEGGDTWYFDDQTAVHPMFNINPVADGSDDLGTILGQTGTFTEGMSFIYSGESSWIDRINPISPAFMIFKNQSPNYGTGVAYDAGTYKTIGTSHEFGGLNDGTSPSTKEELMAEYLDFLGISTTLNASFSSNATDICEGETVDFIDMSSGQVISWDWSFPGGNPSSSTQENPSVTYNTVGSYDVTLIVSDGVDIDTLTVTDYITVDEVPGQAGTPSGPTSLCENGSNTSYSTSGVTGATSYSWSIEPSNAGTITGAGTNATVNWDDTFSGSATIKVLGTNVCGDGPYSNGLVITVHPLPNVTLDPFEDVCLDDPPFELTGGLPVGGTYTGTGVTNGWFDPAVAGIGTHIITYTYIDQYGCENFAEETIYVDGCVGINDISDNTGIEIFPNPNTGSFTLKINLENNDIVNIRIINSLNEIIYEEANIAINDNYSNKIDLSEYAKGIYYLKITGRETNCV
ncbi:MAG: PKD domain-containing protein, partial [Bacteroidales bacterium]|nr:PKD domain-containing protein [Bacteroidales bacterium]